MSQENGPTPGLFSHTTSTTDTSTAAGGDKVQRPVFSSGPARDPQAPADDH